MNKITTSICLALASARREHGLTQSAVAREVGCKQSAISMFESGDPTKLSRESAEKFAALVELDISKIVTPAAVMPAATISVSTPSGYCPDCNCPSNLPYLVGGRLLLRPNRGMCAPSGGKRCVICGEVLETTCPSCGAPLNEGACCAACGEPYVAAVLPPATDLRAWVASRREEIALMRV